MAQEFEAIRPAEIEMAQATIPVPQELSSPIAKIRPSLKGVGSVETKQPALINKQSVQEVESNGTAFVIDKDAKGCLMFTKEHVVHDLRYGAMHDGKGTVAESAPGSNGPDVVVKLPELGPRKADVLLADESTDSAILHIKTDNPEKDCKVLPLARSAHDLRSNDLSIIVGYDGKTGELNGLTGFVGGITTIEAVAKSGAQVASPYVNNKFVNSQALIAIYQAAGPKGYSGGPTFNALGEVIGSNHAQVGTGTLVTPIDIVKAQLQRIQHMKNR